MDRRDILIWAFIALAAATVPAFIDSRYVIGTVTMFFIWATVATQWNLVLGVAGIFSLAQLALFAVGAYGAAMLNLYLGWPMWLAMPGSALITVAISFLVGLACLRVSGAYVALLTLAMAQAMYFMIITDTGCFVESAYRCEQFTGGTRGLARFDDLGFRALLGANWYLGDYYAGLVIFLIAGIFTFAIIRSPIGLAFQALRDHRAYAVSRGISQFKYQLLVFCASAFFTGLAGAYYAAHFKVVTPNVLNFSLLLLVLAMIVVGGIGHRWGPIVGAVLLTVSDQLLRQYSGFHAMGLGLIIILFIVFQPDGVVGGVARRWAERRLQPPPAS
jgi:branched-chain amino acid transport system permease protein